MIDLSKHLVKPGLYFMSKPNDTPCMYLFKSSAISCLKFSNQGSRQLSIQMCHWSSRWSSGTISGPGIHDIASTGINVVSNHENISRIEIIGNSHMHMFSWINQLHKFMHIVVNIMGRSKGWRGSRNDGKRFLELNNLI